MSHKDDYKCYNCHDLGFVLLEDETIVAHCWCEAGDRNKKSHPKILQAIRNSNFKFKSIKFRQGPKTPEEFWERANMWKTLLEKSEKFWTKNYIKSKASLPYKDN